MSKKMATVMMFYGLLLAGFAYLISTKADEVGLTVIRLSYAVGASFAVFGAAAWTGYKKRHWLVISQLASVVVFLNTTYDLWFLKHVGTGGLSLQLSFTAMLILGMGMLLYLFHGERSPEFYKRVTQNEPPAREGHISTSTAPRI